MHTPAYISPADAPAKKKILVSALKLFVQRGLCETTVRDIAANAGYTNPALFKHFESKEALALHLFECCYLSLFQAASQALAAQETFEEKQHAVVAALFMRFIRTEAPSCLSRRIFAISGRVLIRLSANIRSSRLSERCWRTVEARER